MQLMQKLNVEKTVYIKQTCCDETNILLHALPSATDMKKKTHPPAEILLKLQDLGEGCRCLD